MNEKDREILLKKINKIKREVKKLIDDIQGRVRKDDWLVLSKKIMEGDKR